MRDLRHLNAKAADDLADWLVRLDLERKSQKTIYGYHGYIIGLLIRNMDVKFDEFTHTHVNAYLLSVPERSRHIVRSVVNRWFEWGVMDDRLVRSPMGKVPPIRAPHRRAKDIFSEAEVGQLENLPTPDGQLMTILFGSGIRRGEARRLRLGNINTDRGRLYVFGGKGDKDRVVALPATVVVAVVDLATLEGLNRDDYLWYTTRGRRRSRRTPIGDTTFHSWWQRCLDEAGVRYLNPHQTRHTYGYWLRENGFPIEDRQFQMGHDDIRTTRQYDRVTIEDIEKRMARL